MNTREQWIERRRAHLVASGSRDNAEFLARASADAHERLRGPNVADWPEPEAASYLDQLQSADAPPAAGKALSRHQEARLVQELNGLLQVRGDGLPLDAVEESLRPSPHAFGFEGDPEFMISAIERAGFLVRDGRVYL